MPSKYKSYKLAVFEKPRGGAGRGRTRRSRVWVWRLSRRLSARREDEFHESAGSVHLPIKKMHLPKKNLPKKMRQSRREQGRPD